MSFEEVIEYVEQFARNRETIILGGGLDILDYKSLTGELRAYTRVVEYLNEVKKKMIDD